MLKEYVKELPCGANVRVWLGLEWLHDGYNEVIVKFRIFDPNQTFTNSGVDEYGEEAHTVDIAVTRASIPALIRTLQRAYKQSGPVSRRKA